MYASLGVLMVGLSLASSRNPIRQFRALPTISNSLVNLGKIDVSFHFNGINPEPHSSPVEMIRSANTLYVPKNDFVQHNTDIEPPSCPCNSHLNDFKNPFTNYGPTDLLSKVLKSNDLFMSRQEPSPLCCDSQEQVQEDTVFFDYKPKATVEPAPAAFNPSNHYPAATFPVMIDNILPKILQPNLLSDKAPKALEIYFFKNRDGLFDFPKFANQPKATNKDEIQIVGDRELKNEFDFRFRPTLPSKQYSSYSVDDKERVNNSENAEELFKEMQEKKMERLNAKIEKMKEDKISKQNTETMKENEAIVTPKAPEPFTASTAQPN